VQEFCGPEVPGTRQKADLVASFNVLISPSFGIKQAQLVLRKFDPRCDHPRNKESRESLGIEVVGNLGRVIF